MEFLVPLVLAVLIVICLMVCLFIYKKTDDGYQGVLKNETSLVGIGHSMKGLSENQKQMAVVLRDVAKNTEECKLVLNKGSCGIK